MKGWYNRASNRPPPPIHIKIAQITVERVKLYRRVPLPGDRSPIELGHFTIDDSIP